MYCASPEPVSLPLPSTAPERLAKATCWLVAASFPFFSWSLELAVLRAALVHFQTRIESGAWTGVGGRVWACGPIAEADSTSNRVRTFIFQSFLNHASGKL